MEITSHVNRFQAVEQELNVMLKLEDVLVNKVGSITILNFNFNVKYVRFDWQRSAMF